eukprot:6177876-Pleurochrysis_carterae.AAC.1
MSCVLWYSSTFRHSSSILCRWPSKLSDIVCMLPHAQLSYKLAECKDLQEAEIRTEYLMLGKLSGGQGKFSFRLISVANIMLRYVPAAISMSISMFGEALRLVWYRRPARYRALRRFDEAFKSEPSTAFDRRRHSKGYIVQSHLEFGV